MKQTNKHSDRDLPHVHNPTTTTTTPCAM